MEKQALFILNFMLFVFLVSFTIKTAHSRNISDNLRMENVKALMGSKSVMCSDQCVPSPYWYCVYCKDCDIYPNYRPTNPVKYCEAEPE